MNEIDNDVADLMGVDEPEKTPKEPSELQKLLLEFCPTPDFKVASVARLAMALKMTPQGVYFIISRNRITYTRAKEVLALNPDSKRTIADFEPYLH